tara:strand:+ start:108 stop:347 length:240 start_codon:yes stop_codon:yes gene_type:complete
MATQIYIVYAYNNNISSSKYIIGTYLEKEDAINRQKTYGEEPYKYSPGVYYTNDGFVTFTNIIPLGDTNVQVFTTLLHH